MKFTKYFFVALIASSALFLSSCNKEKDCLCVTTVTDADGNVIDESEETYTAVDGDCSTGNSTFEFLGTTTTTVCD